MFILKLHYCSTKVAYYMYTQMQFLELFLFNFPYKYINNAIFAKRCVQYLGYRNTSTFISWQILIELLLCARHCAWVRGPNKTQTDMVLPQKHSPRGTAHTKHIITKKHECYLTASTQCLGTHSQRNCPIQETGNGFLEEASCNQEVARLRRG